jgi:hypothetical protein
VGGAFRSEMYGFLTEEVSAVNVRGKRERKKRKKRNQFKPFVCIRRYDK